LSLRLHKTILKIATIPRKTMPNLDIFKIESKEDSHQPEGRRSATLVLEDNTNRHWIMSLRH
jgi:hypothetical protein